MADYRNNPSNDKQAMISNNMRLFGLPYQFIESVDPRIESVSKIIGTNFVDRIITDAPTVMIIPGKAVFLPNADNKQGTSHALLKAAHGSTSSLIENLSTQKDKHIRYYDFEESYNDYIKYVNIMCRTVAGFLELTETIQEGSNTVSLQSYNWKNYRWSSDKYSSKAGAVVQNVWKETVGSAVDLAKAVWGGLKGSSVHKVSLDDDNYHQQGITMTNNFVQFYIDPSSGSSHNMSNSVSQSQIKSSLDSASATVKEFQFVANTAGIQMPEGLEQMTESGLDALTASLGGGDGPFGTVMSQLLGAGKSVVKGENIILPEIYQSSSSDMDYTIDIHLRSPYGNRYSVYMEVLVPLLHLIALTVPKQATANTFGSPFLVKAYCPGVFNINLGIIESMSISRPASEDCYSVDGLPTEVDVQLRIKDLYHDLSISSTNDRALFVNNTSLIDYLATLSGLDLIQPQISNKLRMNILNWAATIRDIDDNVESMILDKIERTFSGFITL